jgi:hypothetical protein
MSRRKQVQTVSALADGEAFDRAIADSGTFLTVIDIHQAWCGPCSVMEPIYRKAYIELEQPEERLKFYTVRA